VDGNDDPRQRGTAWMAKGGGIGGVGGGALEQPRQWTGRPVGRPLYPWECRAAQSRQARPEEAQEPSWGDAAQAAALRCCVAVELRSVEGREADLRRPEARVEDGRRGHLVGVRGRVRGRVRFRARFRARARGWGER